MNDLFKLLTDTFPKAQPKALEDEVTFFTTEFSIDAESLQIVVKEEEIARLNRILACLDEIERLNGELKPATRKLLDRQVIENGIEASHIAPNILAGTGFYARLKVLKWLLTGNYDDVDRLYMISAIDLAKDGVGSLPEVSKRGRRVDFARVALVQRAVEIWRKYSGEDPEIFSVRFVDFVQDFASAFDLEVDAHAAIQAFGRQVKTNLKKYSD